MKCHHCTSDLSATAAVCPACGRAASGLADGASGVGAAGGHAGTPGTALSVEAARATSDQPSGDASGTGLGQRPEKVARPTASPPPPRAGWNPKKERVEGWAVGRELSHYEVLEVDPDAPDELIVERTRTLEARLARWAGDPQDAALQKIGSVGANRLFQLRQELADRDLYRRQLAVESHRRALDAIRLMIANYVSKDSVLQWREWIAVEQAAGTSGVSRDELEAILASFRAQGVLTGLALDDGTEARTLLMLRDRCEGRGERIIKALWDGRLEAWLERAAERTELAGEVRGIKEEFKDAETAGGCLFLWLIGERRLVLPGAKGEVEVDSVEQWAEALDDAAVREASVAALRDGRLENWLRRAMNQPRLADAAVRHRQQGADDVREIAGLYHGQGDKPFIFERGEARTIRELIELCDKHADEAEQYFSRGYLENWLSGEQKMGPLALQAHNIKTQHKSRTRQGLEFFVRQLCKAARVEPYPHIKARPEIIDFGPLPIGKPAEAIVSLLNEGRGHAWGAVSVEPELPGLSVTDSFGSLADAISVRLDTLHLRPGRYEGRVHIAGEGVPEECVVPVSYEVVGLGVEFHPPQLDLGVIPQGKTAAAALRVAVTPGDGRLAGGVTLAPPCEGAQVSGRLDGASSELRVDVNTASAEPGRRYKSSVHLKTNVGEFDVPLHFSVGLRWDVVAAWAGGMAVTFGAAAALCRYALANADEGLSSWLVSYGRATTQTLVATGTLGLLALLPLGIYVGFKIKKR